MNVFVLSCIFLYILMQLSFWLILGAPSGHRDLQIQRNYCS